MLVMESWCGGGSWRWKSDWKRSWWLPAPIVCQFGRWRNMQPWPVPAANQQIRRSEWLWPSDPTSRQQFKRWRCWSLDVDVDWHQTTRWWCLQSLDLVVVRLRKGQTSVMTGFVKREDGQAVDATVSLSNVMLFSSSPSLSRSILHRHHLQACMIEVSWIIGSGCSFL